MLLQLKKAVQEGGFSSPQTQVLLDAVALQGPLMFDWRQVARACLTAVLPASASTGELIARGCAFGKTQELQPLAAALSAQMMGVTSALQAFALQMHPGGCFHCGQRGHVARECPKKREPVVKDSRVRCWVCGRSGHRARECSQCKGEVKEEKMGGQSGDANAGTKTDLPSRPQAWVPTPIEQGWTSPPSSFRPENDW